MSERITVKINPLPDYIKYASSDYILCSIDFYINHNGIHQHFYSESSNNCIRELLQEIELYLSGEIPPNTELYYYIPWIAGNYCVYPYSFKVNSPDSLSFRYKRNQNDAEFDFECSISKDDVISMQNQLKEQFSKIDWESLGKTPIYTFDFPDREYEWCYSAKALCQSLDNLCFGKSIKAIYVSAMNHAEPLRVEENFVNYYLGSNLKIRFEDILLDLLIFAGGLFKYRVFETAEYTLIGPTLKFIENSDNEFCDIGNVYGAFKSNYTSAVINNVSVDKTDCWPWAAKGFDESKLGNPIELPKTIIFRLSNKQALSFHGWDDDFVIKLLPV